MKKTIEQKEKDKIFLVSQLIFKCLSPDFAKPFQIRFCERFGSKYNLEADTLSRHVSCIKAYRGINKKTFPINSRNKVVVKLIADLTISELEDLINLNNSKDFDLHTYLKEKNEN